MTSTRPSKLIFNAIVALTLAQPAYSMKMFRKIIGPLRKRAQQSLWAEAKAKTNEIAKLKNDFLQAQKANKPLEMQRKAKELIALYQQPAYQNAEMDLREEELNLRREKYGFRALTAGIITSNCYLFNQVIEGLPFLMFHEHVDDNTLYYTGTVGAISTAYWALQAVLNHRRLGKLLPSQIFDADKKILIRNLDTMPLKPSPLDEQLNKRIEKHKHPKQEEKS